MGVHFAALARGHAAVLREQPSAHDPHDWAWAKATTEMMAKVISKDELGKWGAVPTEAQMAALGAFARHACRQIASRVAQSAVSPLKGEAEGVRVRCNGNDVRMVREASGVSLKYVAGEGSAQLYKKSFVYEGSFEQLFEMNRKDLLGVAMGEAFLFFGAGSNSDMLKAGESAVPPEGVGILLCLSGVFEQWSKSLAKQAGLLAAERAAAILYDKPLVGTDAAKMLMGAARHQGGDPISNIFNLSASAWEVEAAEQSPEAAVFVAVIGEALFGSSRPREFGREDVLLAKKELRKNYGLSEAGWKALLRQCKESDFFAPLLGAELTFLAASQAERSQNIERFEIPGLSASYPDGRVRSAEGSFLHSLCLLASVSAGRGISLATALPTAMPMCWEGGATGAERHLNWSSLLNISPRIWREWAYANEALDDEGQRKRWQPQDLLRRADWDELLDRHKIGKKTLLDPSAFSDLFAAGWKPHGEQELTFAAMEQDRYARASKSPALVGSIIQRAAEAGWSKESVEAEEQEVFDFLSDVELGFWSEAPKAITWPWIRARSQEWHDAMVSKKSSEASWSPIQEDAFECGQGWVATELVDGGQLHAEGKQMSHCVSSYAKRCASGDCRIFSLRSSDGAWKSTIEVKCVYRDGAEPAQSGRPTTPLSVTMIQQRGFANSAPSLSEKIAAGRLVQSINDACAKLEATASARAPHGVGR